MIILAVPQQLLSMFFIPNVDWVASQKVENLDKHFGRAVGDFRGKNRGGAKKTFAVQARENFSWVGKEDGKAECEVVGRIARRLKEVPRKLEVTAADGNVDFGFEKLGNELGHWREMGCQHFAASLAA